MKYKQNSQYRLPYFNYASSALYFVTICCNNRNHHFGVIEDGVLVKSWIGELVESCLRNIPNSSPYAFLDSFVVMPDHVHAVIGIDNSDEKIDIPEKKFTPRKRSLSIVVRNFKAAVSIFAGRIDPTVKIWQTRYYDRIIRNERELNSIRTYMENNPIAWWKNKNVPQNITVLD